MGLAALMIFMKKDLPSPLRYLAVGVCCILSYPGNWNLIAVLWVLVFGIFHDEKKEKMAGFLWGDFAVCFGIFCNRYW